MSNSSHQKAQSGSQSAPSPAGPAGAKRNSDRVLGVLCLAFGIWYVFETRNFVITAFGTGPVGPKTLPTLLGIVFSVMALVLILRPDESPDWGTIPVWSRMAAVVATSFLFGQLLGVMGFIVASTILAIVIGVFFKGPLLKLIPMSLVFAITIAFVFNNWLELHLPVGWWGGF